MTALIHSQNPHFNGLRPINPMRDLPGVANLIEHAFAHELDSSGQSALEELRWLGRFKPLLWWMLFFQFERTDYLSGFVWEDEKVIIGNVTLNPMGNSNRRWLISNVAVAKSYRKQGIARQLMQASIEQVRNQQGAYILLQVRADNTQAKKLYQALQFQEVCGTTYLQVNRVPEVNVAPLPHGLTLRHRRFNGQDTHALYRLVTTMTPEAVQHEWPVRQHQFEVSLEERFKNFWRGLVALAPAYWFIEDGSKLVAAIQIQPSYFNEPNRIELIVHPKWWGQLEDSLISLALDYLIPTQNRPTLAKHPTYHEAAITTYCHFGFVEEQTLCWMKRTM